MSTFLAKLFPGASSSSSSSNNTDLGSMESLCQAINELCREKSESVGERAAELVRKNRELFEKKPNDVEAFLLHCSPNVGSAAMVAAIKGMFDVSSAKNNETGTDRAVELLNHYVAENNFVGEHLKLVPEIIFPLLRNIGLYCLEKKDKPEIGQRIILKALGSMYPRDFNGPRVLTSAHSVLFACALKTKDYAAVEPFIEVHIDEVANEKCVEDHEEGTPHKTRHPKNFQKPQMGLSHLMAPAPFVNPKFVLEYLYNAACILIELHRFEDALLLLEICVAIPAFTIQEQHVDGYKKYVLISLLLNGRVADSEKQSGTRNVKGKAGEYKQLADLKFSRSAGSHVRVEEVVNSIKERLKKDDNLELAKLVVLEMKKKTIISLTRMFASISIAEIAQLGFLKTVDETTKLIDELVAENRITVRVEGDMVFWSEVTPVPSKSDIEAKMRIVDNLNELLIAKNQSLKKGSGLRPTVLFNDDEGLSMPPLDQ